MLFTALLYRYNNFRVWQSHLGDWWTSWVTHPVTTHSFISMTTMSTVSSTEDRRIKWIMVWWPRRPQQSAIGGRTGNRDEAVGHIFCSMDGLFHGGGALSFKDRQQGLTRTTRTDVKDRLKGTHYKTRLKESEKKHFCWMHLPRETGGVWRGCWEMQGEIEGFVHMGLGYHCYSVSCWWFVLSFLPLVAL